MFKPAWWLQNPHLQTIWPTLFRRPVNIAIQRERIELADGDFIDLDWVKQENNASNTPTVLLLHGLEGSIKSPYSKGMLAAIQQQGWQGVLMHFRGCSGETNRHARSYHSGDTNDLAEIIDMIKKRKPHAPIAAVGFSLGGNVLLKWLGETGDNNPLCSAAAISVPFELHKTADRIQRGFSQLYQWHFLRSLRKKMHEKFQQQDAPIKMPPLNKVVSLRDFDNKITAPLHGFQDADDYYLQCSSKPFLKKIKIPTLLIQSKDDPFMTNDILPEPHELTPHIIFELTERGGHVGFVTGKYPWSAEYWLEQRVPDFLAQCFNENDKRSLQREPISGSPLRKNMGRQIPLSLSGKNHRPNDR